ncbi:DUF2288 domain-containing protein [Polyangium jinanense]|uniref:DUF2288 domain-containing protein n=1 Tax=Polyangium jinanense TaxID=2829994 RepID=UPI0023409EA0|nr:DUF2288 domain-containing protein [Polyangium jinanense]MDC3959387.1 DUF2288 domain-containing protein [Polyangium jinanense]
MRERIAETLGDVHWSDLRAHVARDAVIIVDDALDLLDVGVALAKNDVPSVDAWIRAGKLQKPTAEELTRWSLDASTRFRAAIVQPFVLIRRPAAKALS